MIAYFISAFEYLWNCLYTIAPLITHHTHACEWMGVGHAYGCVNVGGMRVRAGKVWTVEILQEGSFASPFLQTRRVVLIPCLVHLWGDVPITLHPSAISHGETRHLLSSVQWDSRRQNLPGNYKYLARPVSAIYSCLIWFIITECGGRFARKFSSFRGVSKRYNLTSPWLWWVGLECSHLYTQRNKVASGSPQCLQHRSG